MTRHYGISSLFHIRASFVHMTNQFAHQQAVSWAVNGSRRFRDCLTLPTLHKLTQISEAKLPAWYSAVWETTSTARSETPRFCVSNVIFAINGTYTFYNYIKTHVLRCTTIGFKQKYGHSSSRSADESAMQSRVHGGNRSVFWYWTVES